MGISKEQLDARAARLALLDWKTWLAILPCAGALARIVVAIAGAYPYRIAGINQTEVLLAAAAGGLLGLVYGWRHRHHLKRLSIELGVDLDAMQSNPVYLARISETRVRGAWIGASLAAIATLVSAIATAMRPANSFGEAILSMNLFTLLDPIVLLSCAFAIFHRSRRGAMLFVAYSSFVVVAVQIPRVNALGMMYWFIILVVSISALKGTIDLRKQGREERSITPAA